MDEGPLKAGLSGAWWRSPMLQPLLDDRFGVFDNVFDRAQWLKNLGLSDQQAAFVSDPLDEGQRHAWCTTPWPQLLGRAKARKALLLFGDDASCPPWGTRSSTGARRGHQPMVKTSGQRTGDKVFGVIAYVTGQCWYEGQEGRLTSETSLSFLTRVWAQVAQPIMLLQDGAKYHTSVARPRFVALHTDRLTVFQLPRDAPEYHPIEKLWKNVPKAGTHLPYFPTCAALTATVEHALRPLAKTPAEILALCRLPTALTQAAEVRLLRKSFS